MIQRGSAVSHFAAVLIALLGADAAHAARYQFDARETRTTYETRYLGFIPVRGVFERMTGVLRGIPDVGVRHPTCAVSAHFRAENGSSGMPKGSGGMPGRATRERHPGARRDVAFCWGSDGVDR